MEIFAVYTAWWNYAAAQLADADIAEMRAESNLKYLQATKLVQSWDGNVKDCGVTVAKAERDIDPEVVAADEALLTARITKKLTNVVHENCSRCTALVSREITRRGNRDPYERRSNRYTP